MDIENNDHEQIIVVMPRLEKTMTERILGFVLLVTLLAVCLGAGYLLSENQHVKNENAALKANAGYEQLIQPKRPDLAPTLPEELRPSPVPEPLPMTRVTLTDGASVYDALYGVAFSMGYPEYIYKDGDEQRRESLKLVDVWMKDITQRLASVSPLCLPDLPSCITDVDTVPEGTVVAVNVQTDQAFLTSTSDPFAN